MGWVPSTPVCGRSLRPSSRVRGAFSSDAGRHRPAHTGGEALVLPWTHHSLPSSLYKGTYFSKTFSTVSSLEILVGSKGRQCSLSMFIKKLQLKNMNWRYWQIDLIHKLHWVKHRSTQYLADIYGDLPALANTEKRSWRDSPTVACMQSTWIPSPAPYWVPRAPSGVIPAWRVIPARKGRRKMARLCTTEGNGDGERLSVRLTDGSESTHRLGSEAVP